MFLVELNHLATFKQVEQLLNLLVLIPETAASLIDLAGVNDVYFNCLSTDREALNIVRSTQPLKYFHFQIVKRKTYRTDDTTFPLPLNRQKWAKIPYEIIKPRVR